MEHTTKKLTTAEFIARAKLVHGGRYDYSKAVYVNGKAKLVITCPVHGKFLQGGQDHLSGRTCARCAGKVPLTTESFVFEAKLVHGDRYDYSQAVYINSKTKLVINCPEHGPFEQPPATHLQGTGCRKCGGTAPLSTSDFVSKARAIHGIKYDYSQAAYVKSSQKLTIICPEHGPFQQKANSHLNGSGCQSCVGHKRLTLSDFIARAHAAHGDKYDYSRAVFTNINAKLTIICREHGPFEQTPKQHTNGQGCLKCGVIKNADARRDGVATFIAKAQLAHGVGRYDYSQVIYTRSTEAVNQRPDCHINQRQGCPRCGLIEAGLSNRLTLHAFIDRAKAVHGDRYDYSQVVYEGSNVKIKIICPDHGVFQQWPSGHLQGTGCSTCGYQQAALSNTYDTADFLEKARAAHGHKYDYSQVSYKKSSQKVVIVCPSHGAFEQLPASHLQGSGCTKCAYEILTLNQTYTLSDFIIRARQAHGDKYDYSQAEYTKSDAKITIICPAHGPFEQTANSHVQGSGCRVCGGNTPLNQTTFLARAREAHGDRYDYSQVVYQGYEAKVKLSCPVHGAFMQRARAHLETIGCPKCGREQAQQKQRLHWIEQAEGKISSLYLLRLFADEEEFYKVGITFRSVGKRFASAASLASYQYEVLALHQSTNAARVYDWEQSILESFAHLRYTPKYRFDGETECFSSCNEILAIFPL
jgi:cytochrome c2